MKPVKYGVILLALLLAAMAMVPMVSAGTIDTNAQNGENDLAVNVAKIAASHGILGAEGNNSIATIREVKGIGPLNPSQTVGTENAVPYGATIQHFLVGSIPVTIVYDQNGHPLYWINDQEAQTVSSFQKESIPATRMHEVPSGTLINHVTKGLIVASDPVTNQMILRVEDNSFTPVSSDPNRLLVGICRQNKGCYISDIYGSDSFSSVPFDTSIDYHPTFSRVYDKETNEMKMSVWKSTSEDRFNSTDARYTTDLLVLLNSNLSTSIDSSTANSELSVLEIPCGWIGVSPSISSSGRSVTFGSWINWVWNPLAGVPTINVDFQNELIKDLGNGNTQLIRAGQYKSYTGVGLVGVSDSNTYTVSSAGNYFTLTIMDWQIPSSATCIPASESGMFQTYPNLAVS